MKRRFLYPTLLTAAIAVMAPACVKQLVEPAGQMKAPESFTAEMGDETPTKTTLADDKKTVLWRPEDRIDVFYSGFYVGPYKNRATEDNPVALFVGNATTFVGATEESGIIKSYWAVYPSLCTSGYGDESKNVSDGNSITTFIPHEQTPVAGNFGEGSLVTIAKSETTALQFYHVCGGIKFSLTHEGIQQVVFQGNNGETLAGKVTVTMDDTGRPKITSVEEPKTSITMLAPSGDVFETGTWYYLACAPVELTQGFTLTLRSETETGVYTSTEPVSVKRAIWGTLTNVDDAVTFEPSTNRLYDLWLNEIRYTTSNGTIQEVVHPEAFDANLISNTYENGQGLMVFDGPVTTIGRFFDYSSPEFNFTLTSIELPNSVKEIQASAFSNLRGLEHVRMPNSLTTIGDYAFSCTALQDVILPDKLTTLGHSAFISCGSLQHIAIPEGIQEIKENTFNGCNKLESVELPKGLLTIKDKAFSVCDALESIDLPNGLKTIESDAFSHCNLSDIKLPDGLTTIGNFAFSYCKLEGTITIPSSVTTLGIAPFAGNQAIIGFNCSFASADGRCLITNGELIGFATYQLPSSYTLPADVSVLPSGAISTDIAGTLVIPGTVQTIKVNAISSEINTLVIESNSTTIEDSAFTSSFMVSNISGAFASSDGCLLIVNNVIVRGTKDLNDTGTGAIYSIPSGPTCIGDFAFRDNTSLKELVIPDTVTSIGMCALYCCKNLTSVKISKTVTDIGILAFVGCRSLTSIDLPSTITSIGNSAFSGDMLLQSVTIRRETPPSIGLFTFAGSSGCTFYVPANSVGTYKNAEGWSQYASKIQAIPES